MVAGLSPYARAAGTGKTVVEAAGVMDCLWATAWMMGTGAMLSGPTGLFPMMVSLAVAASWAGVCRWRLGGVTGDCLGAACELSEAIYLVAIGTFKAADHPGILIQWLVDLTV